MKRKLIWVVLAVALAAGIGGGVVMATPAVGGQRVATKRRRRWDHPERDERAGGDDRVQFIPTGIARRIDEPEPSDCHI